MKKRINARVTAALLCALTLPVLPSCQGGETGAVTDVSTAVSTAEAQESTTDSKIRTDLPDKNFGGAETSFLTRIYNGGGSYFCTFEIKSDGETGEPINDAIFRRNRNIEDKYGIFIKETKDENPHKAIQTAVLAGDGAYDAVVGVLQQLVKTSAGGIFLDMNSQVPNLDFSKPWWSEQVNESLTVGGKLYVTINDLMMVDKRRACCVEFNKDMAAEYTKDNLYEIVRSGNWTLDYMSTLAIKASKDLNGDGVMTAVDQFGFAGEFFTMYSLVAGTGEKIVQRDKSGEMRIVMNNERMISVLDKIVPWFRDKNVTITPQDNKNNYNIQGDTFKAGRCLFVGGYVRWMQDYVKASDVNLGVLPMPKYDKKQEQYCSFTQFTQASSFAVPVTAKNADLTGFTLEAMSAMSEYDVLPLFIEDAVKTKYTTDEDSVEMLEIVLSGLSYDLGALYDWGGLCSIITSDIPKAGENVFASSFAEKITAAEAAMQETVNTYKSIK